MATTVKVTGGGKIAGYLNKLKNKLSNPVVRVGFLDHATYAGTGVSIAMVAAIQEFGAPNARFPIPPRPYFRPVIEKGKKTWGPTTGKLLVANNYDGKKTMQMMGELIAGDIRRSISTLQAPPLSPVTVMMRSLRRQNPGAPVGLRTVFHAIALVKAGAIPVSGTSTKPLIDSPDGMVNHVSYEVRTK
jgi:hypothetical protein